MWKILVQTVDFKLDQKCTELCAIGVGNGGVARIQSIHRIHSMLAYKYTGLPNSSKKKYRYSLHMSRVLEQQYKKMGELYSIGFCSFLKINMLTIAAC